MPVRGSTEWEHARHQRPVINMDAGGSRHIVCVFGDCDRDGYENYKIVQHEHLRAIWLNGRRLRGDTVCQAIDAGLYPGIHRVYVFCSERHKAMFRYGMGTEGLALAQGRQSGEFYGALPTGWKGSML